MDDAFYRDPFSSPFNILRYFGNWPLELDSPIKKKLFTFYRIITAVYEWNLVVVGWVDLYLNLGNFKKIIYNLCVTLFTTTITLKNIHFLARADRVNKFRQKLFLSSVSQDEEGNKILDRFRYYLKVNTFLFYIGYILFAPLWLCSSLMSLKHGPRELPFPIWLPLNLEDDVQFGLGFAYHTFAATFFMGRAFQTELGMFSLVLQTTGLYEILGKDLAKINDYYTDNEVRKKDVNKFLIRLRVKNDLRILQRRQMEMKENVEEIESYLYLPMLIQLIGGLIFAVMNGFEVIEATMEFSFKLTYQLAYTVLVLVDLFIWCLLSDQLIEASKKINSILYNLAWYEMETDIRKDILLMIVGAQRIQGITMGKFFTLDLSSFLGIIKNLYSCLTVLRTVTQKNKDLR